MNQHFSLVWIKQWKVSSHPSSPSLISPSLIPPSSNPPSRLLGQFDYLSYIYLGSSVCHIPVCHPVILSSCHSCGTLSYSLCLSNQTDQGDEREGFEREGYRWRDRRCRDMEWEGVKTDFSLYKPNLINTWTFTVPPAVALLNYVSSGLLWRIFSPN